MATALSLPRPSRITLGAVHGQNKASLTDPHSAQLDVLRVGACLTVILLHLSATIVMDREFYGTVDWHISNAIDAATRWCVPVFVMLSGSLLLAPQRHVSPRAFWEKRITRLLPAILVWHAVYFAWRALYWHQPMSLGIIAHDVLIGRPYIHLYFLYLILGLYLVTPFLGKGLQVLTLPQVRQLILVIAGLSIGANVIDFLGSSAFTIFVPYLAYYLAGWYCAQLPIGRAGCYALAFGVGVIIITVSTAFLVAAFGFDDRWSFYFQEDFNPAVMITAVAVFLFTLNTEFPPVLQALAKQLAPWTLGVYLAHPIVVEILRYGYYVSAPMLLRPPYYVPVTFLATCILTFGLVALMHQTPGLRRTV